MPVAGRFAVPIPVLSVSNRPRTGRWCAPSSRSSSTSLSSSSTRSSSTASTPSSDYASPWTCVTRRGPTCISHSSALSPLPTLLGSPALPSRPTCRRPRSRTSTRLLRMASTTRRSTRRPSRQPVPLSRSSCSRLQFAYSMQPPSQRRRDSIHPPRRQRQHQHRRRTLTTTSEPLRERGCTSPFPFPLLIQARCPVPASPRNLNHPWSMRCQAQHTRRKEESNLHRPVRGSLHSDKQHPQELNPN